MECSLFYALLLLGGFSSAATSPEGEPCHVWDSRVGRRPVGFFQCPERLDGADAQFCCGNCSAPYCCSSEEARLDPAQCSLATLQEGEADPTLPSPAPHQVGLMEESGVWLMGGFWLGIIILSAVVFSSYCCFNSIRDCLRSRGCCWRTFGEDVESMEVDYIHGSWLRLSTEVDNVRPLSWPRPLPVSRVPSIAQMRATSTAPRTPCDFCSGSDPLPLDLPPAYSSLDLTSSTLVQLHRSSEPPPLYSSLDLTSSGPTPLHHSSEAAPLEAF